MSIDRRDFLKLSALAGLGVTGPLGLASRAHAALYEGPYYVFIHADGGWDPTSLWDPKGMEASDEVNPMNGLFLKDDIASVGNFKFPPLAPEIRAGVFYSFEDFFTRQRDNLLLINGVDTATNGHDSGRRNVWSGKLAEGHPAFGALVASTVNDVAVPFITNGGYDRTEGLVPSVRINGNNIQRIAYPDRPDPIDPDEDPVEVDPELDNTPNRYFGVVGAADRIRAAQTERNNELLGKSDLPSARNGRSLLHSARSSDSELTLLASVLPVTLDNSNNPFIAQAQIACAAFKAKIGISATLSVGGFDTHNNHDVMNAQFTGHVQRLARLLEGIEFVFQEAERLNIADKVIVVVGSDFGRTPRYNATNGKDHWSITSVALLGASFFPTNRVIGETTHTHVPVGVNPSTLENEEGGIRITPEHIHISLRKLAGIENHQNALRYPLSAPYLPLFED